MTIFRRKMRQNFEEEDELKFIARLCTDVLLEVLIYANRRQLAKVERIGRSFHRIVEHFAEQIPFLYLDLIIDPRFFV